MTHHPHTPRGHDLPDDDYPRRPWKRIGHRGGPHGLGPGFRPGFGPGFGPHGFGPGPFGGRGPRARKGDVRDAILSLLAEEPRNGYGLMKAIQERTGGAWRPSPGSIYPTLQQLVDEELIEATGEGRRTSFRLTGDGEAYVREHGEQLARAFAPADDAWTENGDLYAAVGKLMGAFRQFATEATPEQRQRAVAGIDGLRSELYRILAE